ncbi:ATP-binding protein [Burkholderia sp. JKS000303]|uniref:ATP-binding protein n=1 Tax=Burkholderia sp. JKS000303 TaxID=1938747 RepID=UPI000BFA296E|nr:ATP-binding protein [Burkholderia sp. JKS000303]PFH20911.1 two-component system sensor histidine kinase BaeS [Burkholderia sp. JKS000303]
MKLGITSKLFLAILVPCTVVAIAMGAAIRFSFENNFLDYVTRRNTMESQQLEQRLERAYLGHGNWKFLADDPQAWDAFVNAGGAGAPDNRPPGPPGMAGEPGPPPGMEARDAGRAPPLNSGPPNWRRMPPVFLYDAGKQRIAGEGPPPLPDTALRPLTVAGKTVGWLSVEDNGGPFHAADRKFQAEQVRVTWMIVGAAALLAALLAIVLTRAFLAPVRRLVDANHRLANGDYAVRVPEQRGDEFGQLASDFNRLAETLESAGRARRHFIADISHELRTPLAILRGELEALEDGLRHPSPSTFASLQAEISMLSQLINDLHELSLADIGELTFEKVPVDLAHLIEGVAESFRDRLASKRLDLELAIPAAPTPISGDPHRLTQLMQNLFENALRYTDPGGYIRVAVQPADGQLLIDVQDSFPAVPEPMLPHLFDRFFRVDASRSRQSGGSGLGLALCKHIVDAHGGTIEAMRSPYGGLWIHVRVPLLGPLA